MKFFASKSLAVACCLSVAGHSAMSAAATLTLQEALSRGMDYSLRVQKAQSLKNSAHAELRATTSRLMPEVGAVASAFGTKSPTVVNGHNVGDGSVVDDYRAYLEVKQSLYVGGALTSGYSYAKSNEKAAGQRLFEARQAAASEVILAYLAASENQILRNLAKDNSRQLKDYFATTTRYASIGRSKNIDRLQAEANYALSESDVLSRENEYQSAIATLEQLTGQKIGLDIELNGPVAEKPPQLGGKDSVVQAAVQVNPEIKALEYDLEKARYSSDVLMSIHKPSLYLSGTWGYKSPERAELMDSPSNNYTVGLTLKIPLFSGFSVFADRQKNMETVVQAEKTLALSRDELKSQVESSLTNLERDFLRIELAEKAVKSSRLAVQAAIRDYRQGIVSSTDVLSAHRTRYEAERQLNTVQFSYQKNLLGLRRQMGQDLVKIYK